VLLLFILFPLLFPIVCSQQLPSLRFSSNKKGKGREYANTQRQDCTGKGTREVNKGICEECFLCHKGQGKRDATAASASQLLAKSMGKKYVNILSKF
jgi:hypothetical protein